MREGCSDNLGLTNSCLTTTALSNDQFTGYADGIHFFVRMMSGSKTLVLHRKPEDKVKAIHETIQSLTGIPVLEQRLIYKGRQLDSERSLAECMIENDAGLQLVGRMQSTNHPKTSECIHGFVSKINKLCKGKQQGVVKLVALEQLLMAFLERMGKKGVCTNDVASYLDIFQSLYAPEAMVMLYVSPRKQNKVLAIKFIGTFITYCKTRLQKSFYSQCASVVLEICNLLRRSAGQDDYLYKFCTSSLGSMVKDVRIGTSSRNHGSYNSRIGVKDIFPFVAELGKKLTDALDSNLSSKKVDDFSAFLRPIKAAIKDLPSFKGGIQVPMMHTFRCYDAEVKLLYSIFSEMLEKMVKCLEKVKGQLDMEQKEDAGWDQYLSILRKMVGIAKLYQGAEDTLWSNMESVNVSLRYLVVRYAKRGKDYSWINKKVLDFNSRKHLVMLLVPQRKCEDAVLHEMLIDRSQLLSDSFNYISKARPENLSGGFLIKFNNEEATGPGVLREWFSLVCQEIFNPWNPLFSPCPNDLARFFPNPATKVTPSHLEYFKFAGRVIALALKHNIQVGIMLDRTFYLQLAGTDISLEDIKDAEPSLYRSYTQILNMDPAELSDLALTFAYEIEELGSMEVIEFIADGKNIVVNSRNREEYVEHLVQHRFLSSVAKQVVKFAEGFADVVGHEIIQKLVFQTLEFEDLDGMLHGSKTISVEDWKVHTKYDGYTETDSQINWFWEIVEEMTAKQQQVLLFFWTSLKHLPLDGVVGLDSKLHIYQSNDSIDCLPSSHTCSYRLCFPSYPSMAVMRQRLEIITQDHVGCGFGTL